ncbi:MAG: ATP-binding protein [Gammaproteobacteria bacterium]|nr:ATP-binding protein [Gammaproteobacteria bacterium]MCH9743975.1 ATP-binding protein [Gammaproteobacteria bacterium]
MYRHAIKQLETWLSNPSRSPLLIRGARQVGKTYLVEQVASTHFNHTMTINFEFQPECIAAFKTLDPKEIISQLQLETGQTIDENNTLLFLDEIQDCPNAILALRYFKEKMPNLAVIGAGSLLEFTLEDEAFRMPVGRVEFLYLYPLDFKEFLIATDQKLLVEWIEQYNHKTETSETIHKKLLKLVREYCYIGGMPEVLNQYISSKNNLTAAQNQQSKLLQAYRLDFGKYAKTKGNHRYLQIVFERLSDIVGHQVNYSKIDPDTPSRDIKHALNMLKLAGLCYYIYSSSGAGIPLAANINYKKFKLLYIDIGLYLRDLKLNLALLNKEDIHLINSGTLAEQFVGQQLIQLYPSFEKAALYFWARNKKSSTAEVDYLWQHHDKIIPIEVKAGATGRLKSLHMFRETYQSPFGIRISSDTFGLHKDVLSIPFYLVTELERLTKL